MGEWIAASDIHFPEVYGSPAEVVDLIVAIVEDGPRLSRRAACRIQPDLWTSRRPEDIKAAVSVCRTSCPALRECRRFAQRHTGSPLTGIYAGAMYGQMSADQG